MTKFKAGDVVERISAAAYEGLPSGEQGVVSKAAGNLVWIKGYGDWRHLAESLRLAEQDDPLPPAPGSVRYYDDLDTKWGYLDAHLDKIRGQRVVLALNADKDLLLLSADAALQLAHDLNRMANEIKRKEKRRLDDC